jgi:hypothetical protein
MNVPLPWHAQSALQVSGYARRTRLAVACALTRPRGASAGLHQQHLGTSRAWRSAALARQHAFMNATQTGTCFAQVVEPFAWASKQTVNLGPGQRKLRKRPSVCFNEAFARAQQRAAYAS